MKFCTNKQCPLRLTCFKGLNKRMFNGIVSIKYFEPTWDPIKKQTECKNYESK